MSHCGSICISSMSKEVEHLFISYSPSVFFSALSFHVFCLFSNWIVLLLSSKSSLYILGTSSLIFDEYFLPAYIAFLFISFIVSFANQKFSF